MKKAVVLSILFGAVSSFAGAAFVDSNLDMIFPNELGGLEFDEAVKYDADSFGYSVSYKRGESFSASVTVCDLGLDSNPDGYEGKGINLVFQGVETARKLRVQNLEISSPRKRGSAVTPKKGAIRFANTVFQHKVSREVEGKMVSVPRIQSVYVTAMHGQLITLDFTFDVLENKVAHEMSKQMVVQLISMLQSRPSQQDLLMASCDILLKDPSSYGGRTAGQRILDAAKTMDALVIYPDLFAWPTSYYNRPRKSELLIASYFAGMLQVIVPQQLDAGGESEGFAAMLSSYKIMRTKEEIVSIDKLDEWLTAPDPNALFDQLMVEFNYRLPGQ